jgi:hypothetical protein
MITSTQNRNKIDFTPTQNGTIFTASIDCLVVFYAQSPMSGSLGHYRGATFLQWCAFSDTQRGVMMLANDSLIASSIGIPFSLYVVQL